MINQVINLPELYESPSISYLGPDTGIDAAAPKIIPAIAVAAIAIAFMAVGGSCGSRP